MKKYFVFWLSQAFSQLGTYMTSFALILWMYTDSHSVMSVSLMTLCEFVPHIIVSLFSGNFVDSHKKKDLMLVSDGVAALSTTFLLVMYLTGKLQPAHVYAANIICGAMGAIQSPASSIATTLLVPKDRISNASGLLSLSENTIVVIGPALAAALYSAAGIMYVILFDLFTFLVAFLVLLFAVHIEEKETEIKASENPFGGFAEGLKTIWEYPVVKATCITLIFINFLSKITYENILSPMLLARSGDDTSVTAIVNSIVGAAGILGGALVSLDKKKRDDVKLVYIGCALSFSFGDLVMAVSKGIPGWCVGAVGASLPIPFIVAGISSIFYGTIPTEKQGRALSARSVINYSAMSLGIFLGGFLADNVFEPFMSGSSQIVLALSKVVGSGNGSGMGLMFLCSGTLGCVTSLISYFMVKSKRKLIESDSN